MPVKAKGKIKREKIAEDEQAIEEFEKRMVEPTVKRSETKREKQNVSSRELVNVMSDTFDRLFAEFDPRMGEKERRAHADDRATRILRLIKHGIPNGDPARITEEEQEAPLCRNCNV